MIVMGLIAISPMLVFMTGVGAIIAAPHVKKKVSYLIDAAHKGKLNPQHDTYSVIVGSMIHNADEWSFDMNKAVWPRPEKGKYQIMIDYDRNGELSISMMRDGGSFRPVTGYWKKVIRDCMVQQASKIQTEKVYKTLFPNGAPQLLLTKAR